MIGLARAWHDAAWFDPSRIAKSLGIFAGAPADQERIDNSWLFELAGPRGPARRGWRATRTRSGLPLLFNGWLDDRDDLARELGIRDTASDALYAAAFDTWGDGADQRLNGTYSALIPLTDGRIRLSRAPLGAFPLFYAADSSGCVICSVPRPIFAAGWPQELRSEAFRIALAMQVDTDGETTAWNGIRQIPDGTIAYLSASGIRLNRWYDLTSLRQTTLPRDQDYVEAARELLARSVHSTLGLAKNPALTLSGGLDSSNVAAEVLRQLPAGRTIKSFTFHPLDEWNGPLPAHNFADDRPHVRAFAAMYPQLEPHFVDNRNVGFDHKARELFLAGHSGYPSMTVGTPHHGVAMAAVEAGCDFLISAGAGNMTISQSPPWSYPEMLLKGHWRELWKLAANRAGDPRSMPRRIAALAVAPLLPPWLARTARDLVLGRNRRGGIPLDLLRRDTLPQGGYGAATGPDIVSRRQWLSLLSSQMGASMEMVHAHEQAFGIRGRDVTNYRPLVEFCLSIPTDQFIRGGEDRWLARRMGIGRMPEAQRTERLYGRHNADWFPRQTERVDDMKRMVQRIADQPELAPHVDIERAMMLLDNWPAEQPAASHVEAELRFVLPSILLMSQYIDFVTGRNPE
jgi:asparagine synthase (glutamine-hydrolysing)